MDYASWTLDVDCGRSHMIHGRAEMPSFSEEKDYDNA